MKKLFVQWGGGNIGRSFIGQVFSANNYQVTFIDINQTLIAEINTNGKYVVETIFYGTKHHLEVTDISAISAYDQASVDAIITEADLMGVSVGRNVWPHIAKQLAHALTMRYREKPSQSLDIILAENMPHGADFVTGLLKQYVDPSIPFGSYIGLVETSIGKMVPIQESSSSLLLKAEPYDQLIVDRDGFLNPIPHITQLFPVSPIEAYVERKLFIHNMGHACTAYLGFKYEKNTPLIAQVLKHQGVSSQVRQAMLQSMNVLLARYPTVFTKKELIEHIDDLLLRFGNSDLGDTVYRVGRDLRRKLRFDDRLMGIIIEAHSKNMPWDMVGRAYLAALDFHCTDSQGNVYEADKQFLSELNGLDFSKKLYKAGSWEESKLPYPIFTAIAQAFAGLVEPTLN